MPGRTGSSWSPKRVDSGIHMHREDGSHLETLVLALGRFRRPIRDYFAICDSYFQAIRASTPQQIETVDMARRGIHNEAAELLKERLSGKIEVDFDTARRLFTLICVLHIRGRRGHAMTDDIARLIEAARAAARHAHAPYSRFAVGAALLMADGSIVTGANVENASYGLSLCAETVAVATASAQGKIAQIVAIGVIGGPMDAEGMPMGEPAGQPLWPLPPGVERGGADGGHRSARALRRGAGRCGRGATPCRSCCPMHSVPPIWASARTHKTPSRRLSDPAMSCVSTRSDGDERWDCLTDCSAK